ncbi:hypothetical protein ABZY58_05255 [Micromonospora tulbaghiae]|uniref:hypothetical protein n=1 Tax=Micromonospora tulbaghiae TaxID=479978 RepID=UPI0033AF0967
MTLFATLDVSHAMARSGQFDLAHGRLDWLVLGDLPPDLLSRSSGMASLEGAGSTGGQRFT